MGATLYYTEEVVGEQVICDCGYETDYVDYGYSNETTDVGEEWTCPQCGKTFTLNEDFI